MFQNQIYIPPKDQSTCCGVCRNISCLYEHENGTTVLYKVGSHSDHGWTNVKAENLQIWFRMMQKRTWGFWILSRFSEATVGYSLAHIVPQPELLQSYLQHRIWCCRFIFSAREVLGVKLHEVRLHWHSVRTHTHLLLLQLPPLQWDRVYEGQLWYCSWRQTDFPFYNHTTSHILPVSVLIIWLWSARRLVEVS